MAHVDRDHFIRRIAIAVLTGRRKSELPADPVSGTAYATDVADKLPGAVPDLARAR